MVYYKRFFVLFFILILFCGVCFAVDEDVELSVINNLYVSKETNFFQSSDQISTYYCVLEKGYVYTVHDDRATGETTFAFCNETPAVNVVYYDLTSIPYGNTYSFIVNDDMQYLILAGNNLNNNRYVTRHKIQSQDTAIGDLVENVGPNALWGVFGSGIDFVFVVVIVAFGIFIIYKLIKGLSKGKSKI